MKTIHLVACCATKLDAAAPAKDLYASQWFRKARAVVEATGEPWYILSAGLCLVHPETVIPPYDVSMRGFDRHERQRWAGKVMMQLDPILVGPPAKVIFWAGKLYCEPLATLLAARRYQVKFPLMGLGIGSQMALLGGLLLVEQTLRKREVPCAH